ncbi:hypothetical protein EIP86_005368 [Pleurotus ostreatoroseus]|nr:hypothetical protein EIP86_005368 [Pleurotus ostreatoroseus]
MVFSSLTRLVSTVVLLALFAVDTYSLPSGWDKLDNQARDILARATPAAPHFVIYGDKGVQGTTGPPPTSDITGFNVL